LALYHIDSHGNVRCRYELVREEEAVMRGWCDLSEKEKEQVDKEMLEKSQENMFFFYRDEIKNFLSGKSIHHVLQGHYI
jgi:hypothetical protein